MTIFVNRKPIQRFNFPGGECSVDISGIELNDWVDVEAYLYSSDDVMSLLLTVNAIRTASSQAAVHLTIPYFPYARQDRVCNPGESFSLQVMASLVNELECETITVLDPHSAQTMALLHRAREVTQTEILRGSVLEKLVLSENLVLLAPDKGAAPKLLAYQRDLKERKLHVDVACCSKERDPRTGEILRTAIPDIDPNRDILIVDDICDGGRTFIELAKTIRQQGPRKLYLYVTHGIFSPGLGPLEDFDHIYCYHSFRKPSAPEAQRLTTIGKMYAD